MMLLNKLLLLFVVTIISISAAAEKVKKHPASTTELTINSHGKRMSGFIYLAAGEAPHPTVLLLHGYPGNEKNLDLAQALRSKPFFIIVALGAVKVNSLFATQNKMSKLF
jgi:hypothetical protein